MSAVSNIIYTDREGFFVNENGAPFKPSGTSVVGIQFFALHLKDCPAELQGTGWEVCEYITFNGSFPPNRIILDKFNYGSEDPLKFQSIKVTEPNKAYRLLYVLQPK